MNTGIKITLTWVIVIIAIILVNYLTKGKLPFFILAFIGFVFIISFTLYFAGNKEEKITQ